MSSSPSPSPSPSPSLSISPFASISPDNINNNNTINLNVSISPPPSSSDNFHSHSHSLLHFFFSAFPLCSSVPSPILSILNELSQQFLSLSPPSSHSSLESFFASIYQRKYCENFLVFYHLIKSLANNPNDIEEFENNNSHSHSQSHANVISKTLKEITSLLHSNMGVTPSFSYYPFNDPIVLSSLPPSLVYFRHIFLEFCRLFLFSAVNSKLKNEIIQLILTLKEDIQRTIMTMIQLTQKKITGGERSDTSEKSPSYGLKIDHTSSNSDDEEGSEIDLESFSATPSPMASSVTSSFPQILSSSVSSLSSSSLSLSSSSSSTNSSSLSPSSSSHIIAENRTLRASLLSSNSALADLKIQMDKLKENNEILSQQLQENESVRSDLESKCKRDLVHHHHETSELKKEIHHLNDLLLEREKSLSSANILLISKESLIQNLQNDLLEKSDELSILKVKVSEQAKISQKYEKIKEKLMEFDEMKRHVEWMEEERKKEEEVREKEKRDILREREEGNLSKNDLYSLQLTREKNLFEVKLSEFRSLNDILKSENSQKDQIISTLKNENKEIKNKIQEVERENQKLKGEEEDDDEDGRGKGRRKTRETMDFATAESRPSPSSPLPSPSKGVAHYQRVALHYLTLYRQSVEDNAKLKHEITERENIYQQDQIVGERERQLMQSAFYQLAMDLHTEVIKGKARGSSGKVYGPSSEPQFTIVDADMSEQKSSPLKKESNGNSSH